MDRLQANQQLNVNEALASNNAIVKVVMQMDGNLVLYRQSDGGALWASNTWGTAMDHAVMQGDGNFVGYTAAGVPLWDTATDGNQGAWIVLQNDGNLVVYDSANNPLWASNTAQPLIRDRLLPSEQLNIGDQLISSNGIVKLIMQVDGNIVLYRVAGRGRAALGTGGDTGRRAQRWPAIPLLLPVAGG